jgi:Dockerin type I domain
MFHDKSTTLTMYKFSTHLTALLLVFFTTSLWGQSTCSLVINDQVTISVNEQCEYTVVPDDVLENPGSCPAGDLVVERRNAAAGTWSVANIVAADINTTITIRVRDRISGNRTESMPILVKDLLVPKITNCNDLTVSCAYLINGYDPGQLAACYTNGRPTATDNCDGALSGRSFVYADLLYDEDLCSTGFTGYALRTWTATDRSGNKAICQQKIWFKAESIAAVKFPRDTVFACDQQNFGTDPYYTGAPFINIDCGVAPLLRMAPLAVYDVNNKKVKDNFCSLSVAYRDDRRKICDGTYLISREWTVIDACDPTIVRRHTQYIRVVDNEGPVFEEAPDDITVSVEPTTCCAVIDLPDFIVKDNCSRINSADVIIVGKDHFGDTIGVFRNAARVSLTSFPGNSPQYSDTLMKVGNSICLPPGKHTVFYKVDDDCGNETYATFSVKVIDLEVPIARCVEFTVVSLGYGIGHYANIPGGPEAWTTQGDNYEDNEGKCEYDGIAWAPASLFDKGSSDNCGGVRLTVRRQAPYSAFISSLNNQHDACDPAKEQDYYEYSKDCKDLNLVVDAGDRDCRSGQLTGPDGLQTEYEVAISENDSIKFYCGEVGTTQTVIMRAYQVDKKTGCNTEIWNECVVQVEVQDRQRPRCVAPKDVTVTCDNFDRSLWPYGLPTIGDNCCLDATKVYKIGPAAVKGLTATVDLSRFDTACDKGTITRTFTTWDCRGLTNRCTQTITVEYRQDYFVRFPADAIVTFCDSTGVYDSPTFFGEDCELLGASVEEEVFTVATDACFKIEKTWKVINWCTYNPNRPCTYVPNPEPNAIANHPDNLLGVTVSQRDRVPGWQATSRALRPGGAPLDYGKIWDGSIGTTFDGISINAVHNKEVNCYVYKQIIKIVDLQKPRVNCPASPVEVCDLTPNDPFLWNATYWWDSVISSNDLCEGGGNICITATDACSGANLSIDYLLFLDLNGDGEMETVVNSARLPAANTVMFDNAKTSNYSGGTARSFDFRDVAAGNKYRFAIQRTTSGKNMTACVAWNTNNAPNTYLDAQLPYGTHKVKWIVRDGCGNESTCEYLIVVKDCKKPNLVCANGLATNLMNANPAMVSIVAKDFLQFGDDNCTPANQLVYSIRKKGSGTGFPTMKNASGADVPVTTLTWDCNEQGTQFVELWAKDKAGNADFCETYILIQDNAGACPDKGAATVAGTLVTESAAGVEEARIELDGVRPNGQPPVEMFRNTDDKGNFLFSNALPLASSYVVTPTKDDNPLNGVTTFDLALMTKHILGQEPLNSPYQMIAADVNRSGSITAFDIVELRKLILGVYDQLPDNSSWRFVDKGFQFANPSNPFITTFPEIKTVADMRSNAMGNDFVGIKVGDVNGTSVANSRQPVEERSANTLMFDIEDRAVAVGDVVTVHFKAAEKVLGYQFTLKHPGLEVVDVTGLKSENFAIFADRAMLSTSWDGGNAQPAFAVTFRAVQAGQLSKLLAVSNEITKAEAYAPLPAGESFASGVGANTVSISSPSPDRGDWEGAMAIAFRFNQGGISTISGVGFELYQNAPNPFVHRTFVGFNLPEATEATLTVFDGEGRAVFAQSGAFTKGYNQIALDRSQVGAVGALYYQLQTATDRATKKMIQSR